MKKGLTTLMTVAIALVSVQAMALAPVISDIQSPVIGNGTGVSQTTRYVFADAFDLDTVVADDVTSDAALKWSYEIAGTAKYAINGDAPINSGTEDPVAPAAAKTINQTMNGLGGTTNEFNPDGKANTITIRSTALYPYGGSPSTDMTPAAQAWNQYIQAVTFWCSDGNLASSQTVLFYTDNTYTNNTGTGWNRLSGPPPTQWDPPVVVDKFDGMSAPWKMYDTFLDTCTSHTGTNGKGICFEVGKLGANLGSVQSVMPYFQLTANKVYRLRATMNCSQTSPGKTPFWDFIVENYNGDATKGMNLYAMDSLHIDNENGANAILNSLDGTQVDMYWAPMAFQTAQWKSTTTGANAVVNDAVNDPCLRFRVMDVHATNTANLLNDQKFGAICLQSLTVESIDYSKMVVDSNIVNIGGAANPFRRNTDTVTTGNPPVTTPNPLNNVAVQTYGSSVSFGNTLTLTPSGSAPTAELVEIRPAKENVYDFPGNSILDDYPIAWQTGKLYQFTTDLNAPDTNSQAHPYDVIFMNMEPLTNELITETFLTSTRGLAESFTFGIGSPRTGTAQTYMMFHYSGVKSATSTPNLANLRWRLRFGNASNLNFPNPSDANNNNGKVVVNNIKVNIVHFPN